MSQELTTIKPAPLSLTLSDEQVAEHQEAFAMNVASGNVSAFDLPRIKVMSGAALWLIPGLENDETAPKIEGVIVYALDGRVYYSKKDAGNVPPDCSSTDCITGAGKPGGECAHCSLKAWDSAADGGGGQACKQVKQLFIMRADSMLPEVVSLPPTSLRAAGKFFLALASKGIPYTGAIVSIELEKAQNAAGKPYGRAKFTLVRRLSRDEQNRAMEFQAMAKQLAGQVRATPADALE
jgi:hypothetical protein